MASELTDFFNRLGPEMLRRTYEHLDLTFFSMVGAVAIALPLGIALTRRRLARFAAATLGLASLIQTIPALALLAFIVLLFALVRLPPLGNGPAMTALVLYALLPILRNTYIGIRQVDAVTVEVARAMGMKPRQVLFRIQLPLALPVIMAGIRTATVWTIGMATLAALVGGGGLGNPIMIGLRSIRLDYLLAGTLPAALLALLLDGVLGWLERWLNPSAIGEF